MDTNWKDRFPPWILERGRTYHQMGRVRRLTHHGQEVSALVEGTQVYRTAIRFSRGIPQKASCDCPYAREGSLCKHMAALLFALEELEYVPEDDPFAPTWEEALRKLPPETLRIILRNLAEGDPQLQELLLQLYGLQEKDPQA